MIGNLNPRLNALGSKLSGKVKSEFGGNVTPAKFKELNGLFIIAFTSRTGSSFLCRTLETKYQLSGMGESMNPRTLAKRKVNWDVSDFTTAAEETVRRNSKAGWFGFKGGAKGICAAELMGLIEPNLDKAHFAFLLRRNVVAQSISIFKAKQTGQFHSSQAVKSEANVDDYDYREIAKSIRTIARSNDRLLDYLTATKRPYRYFEYEKFESGDWQHVDDALTDYGVPKREEQVEQKRPLHKLDRSVSQIWEERFRAEMARSEKRILDNYDKKYVTPYLDKI